MIWVLIPYTECSGASMSTIPLTLISNRSFTIIRFGFCSLVFVSLLEVEICGKKQQNATKKIKEKKTWKTQAKEENSFSTMTKHCFKVLLMVEYNFSVKYAFYFLNLFSIWKWKGRRLWWAKKNVLLVFIEFINNGSRLLVLCWCWLVRFFYANWLHLM